MTAKTLAGLLVLACLASWLAHADQVVMQNGDRYNGKVVSLTTNTLVLQSDVLGTINLSRSKVAQVTLGDEATITTPPQIKPAVSSTTKTNADIALTTSARQLKSQPQLIQQVQNQYLNGATPEAKAKFDEMLTDLSTGKMSVGDLRTQAKATADQVRALRKELGDDAGEGLDGYLAILDNFVQAAASEEVVTNKVTATPATPKARK
jgi:hypothetical protein